MMTTDATDKPQDGPPLGLGLSEGLGPNAQAEPLQAGMTNAQLAEAWGQKLPGVAPTDKDLTAFAIGSEVGFAHARKLEMADWMRVHYVLKKHGAHPGRTDDNLADVIDKALSAPRWWRCSTHGPAKANAWGCPECVREMRGELAALHERMADMLDVLRMVDDNHRVDEGENRKAWSGRFVVQEVRRVLALGPNVRAKPPEGSA